MPREPRRKPRASKSRYYITLGRGDRVRCLALRPWALYTLVLGIPLSIGVGAVAAAHLAFPDDGIDALTARQAEMRVDYEDRLSTLRGKIDQIADGRARDQGALEIKLRVLAARQAMLDDRAEAIARLAGGSASSTKTVAFAASPKPRTKSLDRTPQLINPLLTGAVGSPPSLPDSAQAFAPTPGDEVSPELDNPLRARPNKPRPDGVELRSDHEKTSALAPNPIDDPTLPIGARLSAMNADLSGVEAKQLTAVSQIASSAEKTAAKIRAAMAETGLSLRRVAPAPSAHGSEPAMGGPFMPVNFETDGSPFESRLAQLQTQIAEAERITRALPYLPFRQPLAGVLVTTSPFGVRVDPFLGRMAMHTGNDFRGAYGARVMATAAGEVVSAGFDGGYGNMVEIDHGGGLTTRYAHLSEILVVKGQKIAAGDEVGRLGTTGRSTGPHLHYEVRVDGRPVDPLPFVRAGESLFASK